MPLPTLAWWLVLADATSPLNPASPQARTVYDVFVITLLIMCVILAIVVVWIGYILLKFRAPAGTPDPDPVYGNNKLELTWTLIPLLIVSWLGWISARDLTRARPAVADERPADIVVIGHQWWWELQYPAGVLTKAAVVTANEVHIPVGRSVVLHLRAADVVHDFWVPQLGPKHDMVPGDDNFHLNHLWLEPEAAGVYEGACAEFCGNSHAWMRIRVIAEPQATFDAWAAAQAVPLAAPATALAVSGQQVFEQNTCRNCHALAGVPAATATIAPDLSNLGDRQTLGAGVLPNSRENLVKWLNNPQIYKPGCYMPDFHLSPADVQALTEYLWRQSGQGLAPAPAVAPSGAPAAASPSAAPAASASAAPATSPSVAPPLASPSVGPTTASPAAGPAMSPSVAPLAASPSTGPASTAPSAAPSEGATR